MFSVVFLHSLVPCPLFYCPVLPCPFQWLITPCKLPLQTHKYNLVLPTLSVSNWFLFGHPPQYLSPRWHAYVLWVLRETSPPFLNTTRKGGEELTVCQSSVSPDMISSKSSGRRQCCLHLLGPSVREAVQFAKFTKPSKCEIEIYTQVPLTQKSCYFTMLSHSFSMTYGITLKVDQFSIHIYSRSESVLYS